MVAIGPRVGGAHVGVALKFNPRSVDQVGGDIHRQLRRFARRNGQVYRRLGQSAVIAWRAALGAMVTSAPLVGAAFSGLAGAATLLAGALSSTVQTSARLLPVLTSLGIAAGTAAIGMNGFWDAVKSGDLEDLTPSARASAKAIRSLGDEWTHLRRAVQERLFKGLSDDIRRLADTLLPVLEKGLVKMAGALNGLAKSLLDYVNSKEGLKQIGILLDNNAEIFKRLSKAAVPFLDGLIRLLNALSPSAKRFADRVAEIARDFQEWASADGFVKRIDDSMKRAEKTAGLFFQVIGNLGKAIRNIFSATNVQTNRFLQILVDVTERFKEWTASADGRNTLVEWASNSIDVMVQLGRTLEAVFEVLADLADPRVIISFLTTVQNAFEILAKLPLERIVGVIADLMAALEPVSGPILAVIIVMATLNITLGVLLAQITPVIGVLGRMARVFKSLASLGKHGKSVSGLAAAFGRLGKVIGPVLRIAIRFAKFIPFVGWAIWIATVIAGSDKLQKKLGDLWTTIKDAGSAIAESFSGLMEALEPLKPILDGIVKGLTWVLDILDDLLALGVEGFIDGFAHAIEGLGKVVSGILGALTGLVNIITGILTLDASKIGKGLTQIGEAWAEFGDGLTDILDGILYGFVTWVGELVVSFITGLRDNIPDMLGALGEFFMTVFEFLMGLIPRIIMWGFQFIGGLITGIAMALPRVLATIAGWFPQLFVFLMGLIPRIIAFGVRFIGGMAIGIIAGTGQVLAAIGRVILGVFSVLASLPSRMMGVGRNIIVKMGAGILSAIGNVTGAIASVASAVTKGVAGLPGKMFGIGASIVSNIASGITSGIGDVGNAISKVASKISKFLPGSPVREGPLTAWNEGNNATGGGSNLVQAISSGLRDISPINEAMSGIASAISETLTPGSTRVGSDGAAGGTGTNSRNLTVNVYNPEPEKASDSLTRTTRNLAHLGMA